METKELTAESGVLKGNINELKISCSSITTILHALNVIKTNL